MNAKMFNSFITGDKSAIEMAAVVNGSDLKIQAEALSYPAVGTDDLVNKLIPKNFGGLLDKEGVVEVISSIDKNKKSIKNHLRWGIFTVIKGQNKYIKE